MASLAPFFPVSAPWSQSFVPPACLEFAACATSAAAAQGREWGRFRESYTEGYLLEASSPVAAMEVYYKLMEEYSLEAASALNCRMGSAAVFYRLGRQYLAQGFSQRAANLFQLAMSMFWDTTRLENGMTCLQLELWGTNWSEEFMEVYLGHAARLRRNSLDMLPHPQHWHVPPDYREPSLRIAVFSLCEYSVESPMHWLLERSQQNRQAYCRRHGYGVEWRDRRSARTGERHPVWGQLAGPLEMLEASGSEYDWIMSMDCDSLFVNMDITIDSILYRFASRETPWGKLELDPDVHFLISEDGRGLAGGNWIIRNSPAGRKFLTDVYGASDKPEENAFLRHDLRDQFSLLWHLVRPGASVPMPHERPVEMTALDTPPLRPSSWLDLGYSLGVRLVPQELLLGAYPYLQCSQPGDRAHRCFEGGAPGMPTDFIVSVPLLGSLPQDMARAILDRFLLLGLGSLGDPVYERQLQELCPSSADVSRCLARGMTAT